MRRNLKNGVATPTTGYDYLNTVELTTGVRSRRAPTSARDRAPTLSQNIRQGSYTCLISRLVTQWDTFPWRWFGIKRRRAATMGVDIDLHPLEKRIEENEYGEK
ncbi:jg5835 [Pararge aegeria aegeria]|uniref:Jg5835 protein n=1 Tax=Pararge aegeria aegeria TaxID=348720 RepID=A0A8S4RA81_9NEOP|nr:jg5835 [Pararge aegeria aegeria]